MSYRNAKYVSNALLTFTSFVLYCSWRFVFYLATSIYGLVILFKVAHCSVMGYIWEVVRNAFLRRPNAGLFVGFNRLLNPFAPGDFAEKCVLRLVEWFSGHCRAIKG